MNALLNVCRAMVAALPAACSVRRVRFWIQVRATGRPLLILIDEPTEGLTPKVVEVVREAIREIHRRGVSVILVEQKLAIALKVSSRVCVMGHGRIVFEGTPAELTAQPEMMKNWLAV